MAILNCYECEGRVSSLAIACPHCGAPVENKLIGVVESGDFSALQELIAKGANVNTVDQSGWTPLMKAAELGQRGHDGSVAQERG